MYIRAKHPTNDDDVMIEVVRVSRGKKTAEIISTDPETLEAMKERGRARETTTVPTEWLAWIPCGP